MFLGGKFYRIKVFGIYIKFFFLKAICDLKLNRILREKKKHLELNITENFSTNTLIIILQNCMKIAFLSLAKLFNYKIIKSLHIGVKFTF